MIHHSPTQRNQIAGMGMEHNSERFDHQSIDRESTYFGGDENTRLQQRSPLTATMCTNQTTAASTETIENEPTTTTTTTTKNPPNTKSSSVKGILRPPSRTCVTRWFPMTDISTSPRSLFKIIMLVAIPCILCQIYPSWIFVYTTFLCFLCGLLDLCGQQERQTDDTLDSTRIRRVEFVPGTKLHRLPRPLSRKEKHDFVQRRFQTPILRQRRQRKTALKNLYQSTFYQNVYQNNEYQSNESRTATTTATTSTVPTIGKNTTTWNENNGQPTCSSHEESSPFSCNEVVSDSNNEENCASSPSKLIGGDAPMARIRMASRPLSRNEVPLVSDTSGSDWWELEGSSSH
jgi:hypothetical protein